MSENENVSEGILTQKSADYPAPLREIPDPPEQLYYRGDLSLLRRPLVAVVGARKPTPYGVRITKRIAGRLAAAGAVLVSGLAMGVDSVGHRSMLSLGGKTIAVLGQGLDTYYPKSNRDLQDAIAREGLLLTEYPEGTKPARYTFPRRNRIISGLSLATVITEAGVNSGSLITAEWAESQGRPVYCVPGNIDSQYSLGTNLLLCDGAVPLVVPDDLVRDLGLLPGSRPGRDASEGRGRAQDRAAELAASADPYEDRADLSPVEKQIIHLLREEGEVSVDRLCRRLSLSPAAANGLISVLEIKGIAATALGKVFLAN